MGYLRRPELMRENRGLPPRYWEPEPLEEWEWESEPPEDREPDPWMDEDELPFK